MEEILRECEDIIDEVCEKYGYETKDMSGDECLRTVLRKAVPAMLANSDKKDREIFYQMLRNTPIVLIDEDPTKEMIDELEHKYFGNINENVEFEESESDEYNKNVGIGAYVCTAVIDENMQVSGKKSLIYIKQLSQNDSRKEFLGTSINVAHLIHELGHAWNAEHEQCKILDDGTLQLRLGARRLNYSLERNEKNKIVVKLKSSSGTYLEEGMNTLEEESSMAIYMGMSKDEIRKIYSEILVESRYQGTIRSMTEVLLERTDEDALRYWRLYGDETKLQEVEDLMKQTSYYQDREEIFLNNNDRKPRHKKKEEMILKNEKEFVQSFFKKYRDVFFPNIMEMQPMEIIDNIMEQLLFFQSIQLGYKLSNPEENENYCEILHHILADGYVLINQTQEVRDKQSGLEQIKQAVKGVTKTEISKVTEETKRGVKTMENTKENLQGEISKDE